MRPLAFMVIAAATLFSLCCSSRKTPALTAGQQQMQDRLRAAASLEAFLGAPDTILLSVPDSVIIDAVPRARFLSSGFVLFNELGKSIVVLDRNGHFLRSFGRAGAGPGEFRSMAAAAVDFHDSIYVFDPLLARVTLFSPGGACVRTMSIANQFLVRHMCVTAEGNLLIHHAPDSIYAGYISEYGRDGTWLRSGVPADPGYAAYYERGHLEGGVVASMDGAAYETNTFSPFITKLSSRGPVRLTTAFDGYVPLAPEQKFSSILQLQHAVVKATIIRGLQLVYHGSMLVQEVLSVGTRGLSVDRWVNVYDTSGVFLGRLECGQIMLDASDGNRMLQVDNPPLSRESVPGDPRLPRLLVYEIKGE